MNALGWLLGLENVSEVSAVDAAFAAPWAKENQFVIGGVCVALCLLVVFFYSRRQTASLGWKWCLTATRSLLLVLAFLTLANPVLRVTVTQIHKPLFFVLFDGTESMAIRDELPDKDREALRNATDLVAPTQTPPTRMDYVRAWLRRESGSTLQRLQVDKDVRLESFVFDGQRSGQLRRIDQSPALKTARGTDDGGTAALADSLESRGRVTSLGSALADVPQQVGAQYLAGVIVVSDFAHNAGVAPLGDPNSPAARVGVPIYAIGVGAAEAIDLAVTLQTDLKMKRAERTNVQLKLRQVGLSGETVGVRLTARPLESRAGEDGEVEIGQRQLTLRDGLLLVDFPFTPEQSGPFEFTATVDPLPGEVVTDNNTARREVNIIDDFLRLLYVAHEPTWEWRFIKEVFHRDRLVGMEGFRTFLSSSDPRVRKSNVLFAPTLTPSRREFFANDVIFLGDMPADSISPRFADMVKEYVGKLGGGLVVISGPRFGPQALGDSSLSEMLPVVISEDAVIQDDREFPLTLTADAIRYPFMRLGETDQESQKAWDNLAALPWRQPVAAVREQAVVLAEHPTAMCRDGKTRQPIIAIQSYGRGEVVFLSFNEMWRLRRLYGEKHYRRFWSQLIYRLGMSHALGSDKRFSPSLERQTYRSGDEAVFTVEAYDEDYEPLGLEKLGRPALEGELIRPADLGGDAQAVEISIPMLRSGVFEVRVPVHAAGEYLIRVRDPITGESHDRRFQVTEVSAERRRATREKRLQDELARNSDGRSYTLANADRLLEDIDAEPIPETSSRAHALWSTPLWFILVIGCMLVEWTGRKWRHLP